MEIYLDNCATTKTDDDVIEVMTALMRNDYGNPSSKHLMGVEAEKYIRQAKEIIAGILKVDEKEIFFTSGGTESNNLALFGAAFANQRAGKHIITSKTEHDSVLKVCDRLKEHGFELTYLDVDENGNIDKDTLEKSIREDTIIVSLMHVNNETGTIHDISGIGELIKNKNKNIIFHVDAVQSFGKLLIYPKKMNVDMMSVSAHKIHGPKGAGFLYIKNGIKVQPQIYGGGQQKGMRSGTDNVPGIFGMAKSAGNAYECLKENVEKLIVLKDHLIDELEIISKPADSDGCEESIKFKIKINSKKGDEGAPHIVSVTFDNIKSEVLLHALEEKGIYVSAGSACASNRNEISHVLKAMGMSKQEADSTIRFSFSKYNTIEEIDYTVEQLKNIVPVLSKFVSK